MKPVLGPVAQILQFPSNPEEINLLKIQEKLFKEDLYKHETYEERVETRKKLRTVQEELKKELKK